MKKRVFMLLLLLCLLLTGCNNEFAENEYDSAEKIAQTANSYAKVGSIFNPIEGGYEFTVSKFDGRETLWSHNLKEEKDMEIEFSFSLSNGKAKIVHIDADDNVTTLIECAPEKCTDGYVKQVVSLNSGKNRLKIVGYDCEDLELKMLFTEP